MNNMGREWMQLQETGNDKKAWHELVEGKWAIQGRRRDIIYGNHHSGSK